MLLPLDKHRDVCPVMRIAILYLLAFRFNESNQCKNIGIIVTL